MQTVAERFWSKVQMGALGDCWIWLGAKTQSTKRTSGHGYGNFNVRHSGSRSGYRTWRAHRFAFNLTYGPFDENLTILHTCDNPSCVNPYHLKAGTSFDNMQDMVKKGRNKSPRFKGAECPWAKLSINQVNEIRNCSGKSQKSIAEIYGISQAMVSKIKNGKCWGAELPRIPGR